MKQIWQKLSSVLAIVLALSMLTPYICFADEEVTLTPFKNHKIPGTIKSCDFDIGGLGVSYNISGDIQGTYKYRDDAQMNFYSDASGVSIGFQPGNWMKYTINVKEENDYGLSLYYGTPQEPTIVVSLDDVEAFKVQCPSSGGWNDLMNYNIGTLHLTKGQHVLKIAMESQSCSFYSFSLSLPEQPKENTDHSAVTGPFRTMYIPGRIQAEDFDYTGASAARIEGVYRYDEGIDILTTGDSNNFNVKIDPEKSVNYTFNAEQSGVYDFKITANGTANIYFDGMPGAIPVKADAIDKELDLITLYITEGEHTFEVKTDDSITMDYFRFETSNNDYYTIPSLVEGYNNNGPEINPVFKDYYVSKSGKSDAEGTKDDPFDTIEAARDAIREVSADMDGDIIVHILSGIYDVKETIEFTDADSGQNGFNIIYKGESAIEPPVISGGTKITGWTKDDDYIWKAPATNVEATRALFVNGFHAQRARSKYKYPALDYFDDPETTKYSADGITTNAKNFPVNIAHPDELELVWSIFWTVKKTPVDDMIVDGDTVKLKLAQPCFEISRQASYEAASARPGNSFYIENAKELLDEPGEFYFDKTAKMIYYYPFANEDLNTAETYVATTEKLLSIEGKDLNNKIHNVQFDNLSFKYGAYNDVTVNGFANIQAEQLMAKPNDDVQSGGVMSTIQVEINKAKEVVVKNCQFRDISNNAIGMIDGVSDSKIIGNKFMDIGGTAIVVDHWYHRTTMPEGMERCEKIEVGNNVIRRSAAEYKCSTGITAYYPQAVNIHNNDIYDLAYTGISYGWGWGEKVEGFGNGSITDNKVFDIMKDCEDGANIYTLGPAPGTIIARNYINKSGNWRGGIYLDEGSADITVTDNVLTNLTQLWFYARPNVKLKNIVAKNNYTDNDETLIDTRNVTVTGTTEVKDGNWPTKAQEIMDNAGVTKEYQYLLNNTEYPSWRTEFSCTQPTEFFKGKSDVINGAKPEELVPGGEGVGYHKGDGTDVVFYDLQFDEKVIGNSNAGDWLLYNINISNDDTYKMQVYYSNGWDADAAVPAGNLYVDGELVADSVPLPNTASWNDYEWADLGDIDLKAGKHQVKFEFVNNAISFGGVRFYNEKYNKVSGNDDNYDEGVIVLEKDLPINKAATPFTDIAGHWAEQDITTMYNAGIVNGTTNTTFSPDDSVSLYQAIWLALRVAGIEYTDDTWKQQAVTYGMLNSADEADGPVSRERFAHVLMRTYALVNSKYKLTWDTKSYIDFADISTEYQNDVLAALELKLMSGNTERQFLPKQSLTRAEAATVMNRLNGLLNE